MPEQTPAAGSQQGQPQAQQAPMGSSPATGPTPNKGYEAAAMQRLGIIVKQLEQLVPLAGSGSELGKAVLEALGKLAKHVPSGAATPGAERANIERMAMTNTQNSAMMQKMRAQQAQQAQQGAAA